MRSKGAQHVRLRQVERKYKRSVDNLERLRMERNRAVQVAAEAGLSHAEIARVTGLGRPRIGQIVAAGHAATERKDNG